jgi:signal peptidase I
MKTWKAYLQKAWDFIYKEESVASWIVNLILAFLIIKFIFYPTLSFFLQTSLPLVAVVSGSMHHVSVEPCTQVMLDGLCTKRVGVAQICGTSAPKGHVSLDSFWTHCGAWYEKKNITKDAFLNFSFKSGFALGDVMVLYGTPFDKIVQGDVIIFMSKDGIPIIHRVVSRTTDTLWTKGDYNADSIQTGPRSEVAITQSQYVGQAVLKIPWLGLPKVWLTYAFGYVLSIFR